MRREGKVKDRLLEQAAKDGNRKAGYQKKIKRNLFPRAQESDEAREKKKWKN